MSEVKRYYYIDGSEIKGPCSKEYIEELKLSPDTMCWQDGAGLETTQPIAYIREFRHLYPTIPPPVPKSYTMSSNAETKKVRRNSSHYKMGRKKKTSRRKKEDLYGWTCVILSILLFFFCDVIINMAGMKNPSIRMWVDLAVVYAFIKLLSILITALSFNLYTTFQKSLYFIACIRMFFLVIHTSPTAHRLPGGSA